MMFHTRYLSNHGHVVQEECSHHDSNVDDGEGFADHVTIHGIGEQEHGDEFSEHELQVAIDEQNLDVRE